MNIRLDIIFGALLLFGTAYAQSSEELDSLLENVKLNPDYGLNISQFLEKYGYPFEEYEVQTEDGYILGLHRIPHGRNETFKINSNNNNNNNINEKPVVFLQHGLLSCSIDFVNLGPNKALALILADSGYDVWLGNSRGNTWSRKHISLSPQNKTFWEFSFHEFGYYDLPANIDFILKKTGARKLSYVGHSQGTTAFFVMAATKPEYNEKITVMAALAPVAHMKNMTEAVVLLMSKNLFLVDIAVNHFKVYEFFPHFDVLKKLASIFCTEDSPYAFICREVLKIVAGETDYNVIPLDFYPVLVSNTPAGASYQQIKHYIQEHKSGYFRQFDHGFIKNMQVYGQMSPPVYNVSEISAPVALYYAPNDVFAAACDVEQLMTELPNLVYSQLMPENFSHVDFIWGNNFKLYTNVLNLLNNYLNE